MLMCVALAINLILQIPPPNGGGRGWLNNCGRWLNKISQPLTKNTIDSYPRRVFCPLPTERGSSLEYNPNPNSSPLRRGIEGVVEQIREVVE